MAVTHFENIMKIHEQLYSIKILMAMKCVVLPWQQWLGDSNQKLRNLRFSKCKAMGNFR